MDYQSEKSFGKLSFRAFAAIPSNPVHIEDYYNLRRLRHTCHYSPKVYLIYLPHLRHALIYTVFDGMVGKPYVSAFQNFFRIENPLNIKQVMSKNVSDNNNAAMLLMSHVRDIRDVKYLNKRSKATLYKAMLPMSEM